MKLKADFVADWIELLKEILTVQWGYDISGVSNEDLPLVYFNAEQRRIEPKRRVVNLADRFKCPRDLVAGWQKLRVKIENGQDVSQHLSKLINRLYAKDSLLNDWGVHHFHLGENLEGDFIERTGPLLFALVTEYSFYAVNIYQHGEWAQDDVIESIHRNWPDVIARFKINAVNLAENVSERDRLTLRNKNANVLVKVADGTIYAPIGGVVVGSGFNIQSVMQMDRQKDFLNKLQEQLESRLTSIRDELIKLGYNNEPEVEAKLVISDKDYTVVFTKYGLAVKLLTAKA